jgi:hypothetical protein
MRYLLPLEMFVPLFVVLVAVAIRKHFVGISVAALVLLMANAAWLHTPRAERIEWQNRWFSVKIPDLPWNNAVVVLRGGAPMSYVIPFFPTGVRFLRPEGNLISKGEETPTKIEDKIFEILRRHDGPLYVLVPSCPNELSHAKSPWRLEGWTFSTEQPAVTLQTNVETLVLIPMVREESPE